VGPSVFMNVGSVSNLQTTDVSSPMLTLKVCCLESPLLIDLVLKTDENLKPLDLIFCCHFVVQALNFVVQVLNEKSIFLPCDIISNNAD